MIEMWGLYSSEANTWLIAPGGNRWSGFRVDAHAKVVEIAMHDGPPHWEAKRLPQEIIPPHIRQMLLVLAMHPNEHPTSAERRKLGEWLGLPAHMLPRQS